MFSRQRKVIELSTLTEKLARLVDKSFKTMKGEDREGTKTKLTAH